MNRKTLKYKLYAFVGFFAKILGVKNLTPIFIIGTGRCGSTLLNSILDSNAQLNVLLGEGNEFWHHKAYPYQNRKIEVDNYLKIPEEFTATSIKHWSPSHKNKIKRILAGFQLLNGKNKPLIVKSAMISFLVPELMALFSNAKFIHLYRHGLPVVESLVVKEWNKNKAYFKSQEEYKLFAASYWNKCILGIEKFKNNLLSPTNFLELRYEELCSQPKSELKKVADFIGAKTQDFKFDLSKISNRNKRTENYSVEENKLLNEMQQGLQIKNFYLENV
jgi:hypothetical protein